MPFCTCLLLPKGRPRPSHSHVYELDAHLQLTAQPRGGEMGSQVWDVLMLELLLAFKIHTKHNYAVINSELHPAPFLPLHPLSRPIFLVMTGQDMFFARNHYSPFLKSTRTDLTYPTGATFSPTCLLSM